MFDGPYYDLVYDKRTNTGRHNSVISGSFRKDFNYDRVLEHAAYSNSRARYVYCDEISLISEVWRVIDG